MKYCLWILIFISGNVLTNALFAGSDRADRIIIESGDGGGGCTEAAQFADFYALMTPDNPTPIPGGSAVAFPNDGPANGGIVRTGPTTFLLPEVGTYLVEFRVSLERSEDTTGSQLVITLNGTELAYTLVGVGFNASPNDAIELVGMALVTTTTPNSILSITNPSGSEPLFLEPFAGSSGADQIPVSAHLVIIRVR